MKAATRAELRRSQQLVRDVRASSYTPLDCAAYIRELDTRGR